MPAHADVGFGKHRTVQARGTYQVVAEMLAQEGAHLVAKHGHVGAATACGPPIACGAQPRIAPQVPVGAADECVEGELAAQIAPDRKLFGHTHAAMQLDRFLGDVARRTRHAGPRGGGGK